MRRKDLAGRRAEIKAASRGQRRLKMLRVSKAGIPTNSTGLKAVGLKKTVMPKYPGAKIKRPKRPKL